ncbi:MAG: hypothetical protein ACKOBV_03385, partial [Candidatus Kapaibacterium sp.]
MMTSSSRRTHGPGTSGGFVFTLLAALAVVCITGLTSCSPEEPEYVLTDTGWTMITTTDASPSAVRVMHQPDNVTTVMDAYQASNGAALSGKVVKIVPFDTTLYLLVPSTKTIEVIGRTGYRRLATVTTAPHEVYDLCFANATTAYAATEDSSVSIIDITVSRLLAGRDIRVSSRATAIAALGNKVCAVCSDASRIDIIDTPTNAVVSSVVTPPVPAFVSQDVTSGTFVVACLGNGKRGGTSPKSPAHIISYSPALKTIVSDVVLSHGGLEPEEVMTRSMAVVDGGFCYVGLNSILALIDTRNSVTLGVLAPGSFSSVAS